MANHKHKALFAEMFHICSKLNKQRFLSILSMKDCLLNGLYILFHTSYYTDSVNFLEIQIPMSLLILLTFQIISLRDLKLSPGDSVLGPERD